MESLALFTAFWLGILTSISPCPLATNIAAISFISSRLAHKWMVLVYGVLYTLGRSIIYIALCVLIVNALVNLPVLSYFLQRYINKILGLLLILVGMVLLDLLRFNFAGIAPSENLQQRLDNAGIIGALLLGGVFALAFCPISAALFFGSLIPLTLKTNSALVLPLLYGIGTGLPVLILALLLVWGTGYITRFYQRLTQIEFYTKSITGIIFIIVGIYYVLNYIWEIKL
ncbi:MAG: aromatic aminobenezylarsenical efflux permease ArsG family transporter [Candidatus Sumerlaeia bacterium]|nr:aromatic aminobenezylarsenical efflux permease ArsG family transporter [Candidatus Sumerlaeia bacterium]